MGLLALSILIAIASNPPKSEKTTNESVYKIPKVSLFFISEVYAEEELPSSANSTLEIDTFPHVKIVRKEDLDPNH